MRKLIVFILTIIISGTACRKPFAPAAVSSDQHFLVVEGFINVGFDSTRIKLSRTVRIDDSTAVRPENGAQVLIETDGNPIAQLTQSDTSGVYAAPPLYLNTSQKYRVHIITSNHVEYVSDYVQGQATPPVDSITFRPAAVGNPALNIYVTSHDPQSKTHYYRFDYEETWEFVAAYKSDYYVAGQQILPRLFDPVKNVYKCWGNHHSSNVVIGTTIHLNQDLLAEQLLTTIPSTSEKLESRYSVLVHEYAITKEAYDFWENLRKSSEQLGSIFDAQPTSLSGNIHCITNANEPVIGYISASTATSKRIFITKDQLPKDWSAVYPYKCQLDSVLFAKPLPNGQILNQVSAIFFHEPPIEIPIYQLIDKHGQTIGFAGTLPSCGDCTIRGTNKRPSYWPQ